MRKPYLSPLTHQPANTYAGCGCLTVVGLVVIAFVACCVWTVGVVVCLPTPHDDYPAPIIKELQREIAAREAELDTLTDDLREAIAERNEAIALLKQMGFIPPAEEF